jgi:uncharacterized protein with HEPN domain
VSREDRERLADILEAIGAIRGHAASVDSAPAELTRDAILHRLVVIGEAAKAVPEATRAERPDVNWRGIAGLRDLLTHEYFRIDSEHVDALLGEQLNELEQAVVELLAARPEQ